MSIVLAYALTFVNFFIYEVELWKPQEKISCLHNIHNTKNR